MLGWNRRTTRLIGRFAQRFSGAQNTERPVTVEAGANRVAGNGPDEIRPAVWSVWKGERPDIRIPELWDGKATLRIVDVVMRVYS
jgi:UDP-N-acetylglucosamine 2-epimerase (non-hydrolysing)